MSLVRSKKDRRFIPHVFLMRGAQYYLSAGKEKQKEKKGGWYYDWLGAVLLSALSVEAIGNNYGEVLIPDWKDFESASPIAKLRLVATRCGVQPDFGKQPWQTARLLIIFRNRIAHAKRKYLIEEKDCTLSDWAKAFCRKLESDLEQMITEAFAVQSCDSVEQILEILNKDLTFNERYELTFDGQADVLKMVD